MYVTPLTNPEGYWYRIKPFDDALEESTHGHVFKLTISERHGYPRQKWGPYEYFESKDTPLLDGMTEDNRTFFTEVAAYLRDNGLVNSLGLKVLTSESPVIEFDMTECGVVALRMQNVVCDGAAGAVSVAFAKGPNGGLQILRYYITQIGSGGFGTSKVAGGGIAGLREMSCKNGNVERPH